LLRYAFWIKRISISGLITGRLEAFFEILQLSSSIGTLFPNLRGLNWSIYPSLLRFLPLFLSPRMATFSVTVHLETSFNPNMMEQDHLATAVATLPTSLRELTLIVNDAQLGSDELKKEILNAIQRCGQTLTRPEVDTETIKRCDPPRNVAAEPSHFESLSKLALHHASTIIRVNILSSPSFARVDRREPM
jgi:hypothetical protein